MYGIRGMYGETFFQIKRLACSLALVAQEASYKARTAPSCGRSRVRLRVANIYRSGNKQETAVLEGARRPWSKNHLVMNV